MSERAPGIPLLDRTRSSVDHLRASVCVCVCVCVVCMIVTACVRALQDSLQIYSASDVDGGTALTHKR